jgi:hypothetical protein
MLDLADIDPQTSPLAKRLRQSIEDLSDDLFDDEIPPCSRAVEECVTRLIATATRFSPMSSFPLPQMTTLGDGGLSCEWPDENRRVVFSVSSVGESRLSIHERSADGKLSSRHSVAPGAAELESNIRPVPDQTHADE